MPLNGPHRPQQSASPRAPGALLQLLLSNERLQRKVGTVGCSEMQAPASRLGRTQEWTLTTPSTERPAAAGLWSSRTVDRDLPVSVTAGLGMALRGKPRRSLPAAEMNRARLGGPSPVQGSKGLKAPSPASKGWGDPGPSCCWRNRHHC